MSRPRADKARILYVSALLCPKTYAKLFDGAPVRPSQATQKYGRLLTRGLAENGARVIALSAPPITPATCGKRFAFLPSESADGVLYRYLPVIGLPGVKNLVTWACSFIRTLRLCDRDSYVLCYGLNVAVSGGARAAAKLKRIPAAVIVSDIPEQLGGGRLMRMAQRALTHYDAYILLTEAMRGIVDPHDKPYIVLEGQADAAMAARENTLGNKRAGKVCLYAGMLHAKYGVTRLVEAFSLLDDPGARLVLYGTGDAADAVRAAANNDARIEYRGVADNETVVNEEIAATLLLDPRPSDETYTRYSFPSKNLEYMASGTPLLTTDLPGMPPEYRAHVFLFSDETPAGMAEALRSALSLPRETLHEKGMAARAFVLKHKSNIAQSARLIEFLEGLRT